MVQKFVAVLLGLVIAVGVACADEVKGTFVKFADGTLVIKVDDKEKEFKIPADLKSKRKGKDGIEKEIAVSDILSRAKEGAEVTLTVDKEKVTNVKVSRKGK
jgi:hypothetical protein